ncbi:MAG TPA: PAS domain S-box protein [Bryobacteraceae bacterium]
MPAHLADEWFRLAVEAAPCAMVMVNHRGVIVLVNAQTEKLCGYSSEELLGEFVEILVPDFLRRAHVALQRTFERRPRTRPMRAAPHLYACRKDGSQFPVEIGLNPIQTKDGTWVLSSIVDISERKYAETQLRESEQRFRVAVESAANAMVMVDHKGKIVLANAHAEELFGYSRSELVGEFVETLVPVSLRKIHSNLRDRLVKQPQARRMGVGRDLKARRKDGSQFPVEIGLNPIQTKEGTWVLGAIVDISERKRAEAQLRESEERFRNMADNSPVLIWMSGPDKQCTFFNKKWLEFTGRTLEEELGNGWVDKVHPEDRPRCLKVYERAFDDRRSFEMEYRLRRKDEEYRWLLDAGVPRLGPSGVFAGYVGSCLDITDFKRAQEVTLGRQKLESLGLLASGMAHDFSNMQSSIIGLSEILLENTGLDSLAAEEIREIKKIALHGSEIVHQLMIYVGEDDAYLEPVNIALLIEEMGELLRLSISKRVRMTTHLDKSLPSIQANASHMRQLLMNLIINASEAVGEKEGAIDVSASLIKVTGQHRLDISSRLPEGDYMHLAVSDTGCGIPKEIQRKIFDPFYTTKVTGRGLGLAVVQGIVRRYGGIVDLKSAPNKDTRFEIWLPYARPVAKSRSTTRSLDKRGAPRVTSTLSAPATSNGFT